MAERPPRRAASNIKFNYDENDDSDEPMQDSGSGEEQPDDPKEYCVCRGKDDGSFMIGCDKCENWYHGRCINLTAKQGKLITSFICHNCRGIPLDQIVQVHGVTPTQNKEEDYEVNSEEDDDDDEEEDEPRGKRGASKRKRDDYEEEDEEEAPPAVKRQKPPPKPAPAPAPAVPAKAGISTEEINKHRAGAVASLVSALLKDHGTDVQQAVHQATSKLAQDIEAHLFALSNNQFDDNYKIKFKLLATALSNAKNTKLRARILSGELVPAMLVRMSPDELKDEDTLQAERVRTADAQTHSLDHLQQLSQHAAQQSEQLQQQQQQPSHAPPQPSVVAAAIAASTSEPSLSNGVTGGASNNAEQAAAPNLV